MLTAEMLKPITTALTSNLNVLVPIGVTILGAMIGVLKKLKTDNKEIYIINPKSNVKKIFTITGLDKIFKVEG